MQTSFSNAEHLLYFIHAKDNIVKKCASLDIEPEIYINAVFDAKVGWQNKNQGTFRFHF